MRRLFIFAGTLFLALFLPSLSAQDVSSITGVVTDSTGAVVPGVNVVLVNPATGSTYTAVTNDVGPYTMVYVAPGPGYKVTFSREGFRPTVVTDVYLNVNATRTQNAQLAVGGAPCRLPSAATASAAPVLTSPYASADNAHVRNYPIPVIRDDFSRLKGRHSLYYANCLQLVTDSRDFVTCRNAIVTFHCKPSRTPGLNAV